MIILGAIFWISIAGVIYTYGVYPVILAALAKCFRRSAMALPPVENAERVPSATLLISAYNEASVIAQRIEDALQLRYPANRLHIVVVSDGSTDRTAAIVDSYASRGVRLIASETRGGKASALNRAIKEIDTDIVLLSDANTAFDAAAAQHLAAWFADSTVTAVCGRLELIDSASGKNADGLYWKYETFLKKCEGKLGGLLGANGAIYAIRRDRFVPIPASTIVDDFVIPLLAQLRNGGRLVYDCAAVATEETAADVRAEFKRRARIGAGGFQAIALLWPLLNPRQGWLSFTFLSHKILRWLCPFLLVGMFVSSLLLLNLKIYQYIFGAQIIFYLLSVVIMLVPLRARVLKPLRLAPMFTSMNLALLVGFFRWISGRQAAAWSRTDRMAPTPAAAASTGAATAP